MPVERKDYRAGKVYHPYPLRLLEEQFRALGEYCEDNHLSINEAICRAVDQMLEQANVSKEANQ